MFVLHVVPMIISPAGMPAYGDLYEDEEEAGRRKLEEIAHKQLAGIKFVQTARHLGFSGGVADSSAVEY